MYAMMSPLVGALTGYLLLPLDPLSGFWRPLQNLGMSLPRAEFVSSFFVPLFMFLLGIIAKRRLIT